MQGKTQPSPHEKQIMLNAELRKKQKTPTQQKRSEIAQTKHQPKQKKCAEKTNK